MTARARARRVEIVARRARRARKNSRVPRALAVCADGVGRVAAGAGRARGTATREGAFSREKGGFFGTRSRSLES